MTAAVINAALFFCKITHLRTRRRTHFHAPTIQTNSFCFGENIPIYIRRRIIYSKIFLLLYGSYEISNEVYFIARTEKVVVLGF